MSLRKYKVTTNHWFHPSNWDDAAGTILGGAFSLNGALTTTRGHRFVFPEEFYWDDDITAEFYWASTGTGNDILHRIEYLARTENEDVTAAGTTSDVTETEPGTANFLQKTTWTIPATAWADTDWYLDIKFSRVGGDAADTSISASYYLGLNLKYTKWIAGDEMPPDQIVG